MRPPKSQPMTAPLSAALIFLLLLLHPSLGACFFLGPRDDSAAHSSPDDPPCTITSPHTGSFFDLRPLIRLLPQNPPSTSSDDTNDDNDAAEWSTSGHDYNATFHLNICHPILTNLTNPIRGGLSPSNVSAFYTRDGEHFSLGESSSTLILRGKKLILEYTHGSPCAPSPSQKGFTKSTLISFLCDRDFGVGKADVAFVGQSSDCAYFFEIRTGAACATVHVEEGVGLSPGAIFAVIMSVFFLVYFLGGFFYQRIVMNARGWKQIPHYHTWANLLSTISSFFSSLASPLRRGRSGSVRLPQQNHSRNSSNDFRNSPTGPRAGSGGASSFSRRLSGLGLGNGNSAYSQWGSWGTRSGRAGPIWARGVDEDGEVEDENRLLDQLEGEWDD